MENTEFNTANFNYLRSINAEYIDEVYSKYTENADSIDPTWKYFFDGLYLGEATVRAEQAAQGPAMDWVGELKVYQLIQAYREQGHLIAQLNPIYENPTSHPELSLEAFALTEEDLTHTFASARFLGLENTTLANIISYLKKVYCGSIGIEVNQIQNSEERTWIEKKIESLDGNYTVATVDKKYILNRLTASESLEKFIHSRFVAQKRFSIEGGEALIPALDCLIEAAANLGAQEIVMGMAHRGRLNVLINTFKKKPEHLFAEFDDNYLKSTSKGEGDVKYHKGYSYDTTTREGKTVHISLGFNPSHLEFIDPVVVGMTKAKQFQRKDSHQEKVLTVMLHGDSAFSGQGVVYETLQASQLESYSVGGTIHIISNNQVGFTTNPSDTRSTRYCSDLARMLDAPIFHVNGDDPEALWNIVKIATEYRYQFKKDVFIDLICYRKYGHNEGDEPSFTQPQLYKMISAHAPPREIYAQRLLAENVVTPEEVQSELDAAMSHLTRALEIARSEKPEPFHSEYQGLYWSKLHAAHREDLLKKITTTVTENNLKAASKAINHFPPGITIHPKLQRMFDARIQGIEEGKGIDWGNAEVLAYATLIQEGTDVRMTGQDVCRGTFTHRHAAITDYITNQSYIAMNTLHPTARLSIFNSHLSETAALGIEFGYSVTDPYTLSIWEAQFGDFANGAQVIIDQFITTSESKWHRASGLVLLLPHGSEGQGPEHSSARLERFLQLCGRDNIYVTYPTTPSQIFHLLRRQVKRDFRKPLVVMTPKSLLRHPRAVSTMSDLTDNEFLEVIDDSLIAKEQVKRVIVCTGKIYYELLEQRIAGNINDVALIRLEQLYPWPEESLASTLAKYTNAKEIVWVQEEPRNMGAWMYFQGMWSGALADFGARFPKLRLTYVGRNICASPAVGSKKLHDQEQKELILRAYQNET